jgi:hypothetical protein
MTSHGGQGSVSRVKDSFYIVLYRLLSQSENFSYIRCIDSHLVSLLF